MEIKKIKKYTKLKEATPKEKDDEFHEYVYI